MISTIEIGALGKIAIEFSIILQTFILEVGLKTVA